MANINVGNWLATQWRAELTALAIVSKIEKSKKPG
jgi:hypothetical protein